MKISDSCEGDRPHRTCIVNITSGQLPAIKPILLLIVHERDRTAQ
ncbi:hypothetical protein [Microcoleus sp. BROC3]